MCVVFHIQGILQMEEARSGHPSMKKRYRLPAWIIGIVILLTVLTIIAFGSAANKDVFVFKSGGTDCCGCSREAGPADVGRFSYTDLEQNGPP